VVPVDVAIHLVLGEEQRLERGESLLVQRERRSPVRPGGDRERGEQPIHVDHPVRHAAHPRVPRQIVELVHVERARDEPREGLGAWTLDQAQQPPGRHAELRQAGGERAARELPLGQHFVVW